MARLYQVSITIGGGGGLMKEEEGEGMNKTKLWAIQGTNLTKMKVNGQY